MRVTKRHFSVFRCECERLREIWGLTGWRLEVFQAPLEEGAIARCDTDTCQRATWVQLCTEWPDQKSAPTEDDLLRSARHEMIHALLEPLSTLAVARFVTKDELDAGEHEVLHRLDALLPG